MDRCRPAACVLKRLLPGENMPHFDGHLSPDGKQIVFVYDRLQGTDGKLQIDVVNADGIGTQERSFRTPPSRSRRAGRRTANASSGSSTRDKNQDIYAADADGKNMKRLTDAGVMDNNPSWSPDGKQIAFTSGRGGNLDIHLMDADGSNMRRLTPAPRLTTGRFGARRKPHRLHDQSRRQLRNLPHERRRHRPA